MKPGTASCFTPKAGARRVVDNFDLQVPRGAIYHHSSRKRREVECTPELRAQVVQSIQAIRRMLADKQLPPPVNDRRCTKCSLQESCMPSVIDEGRRASAVVRDLFTIHS